MRNAIITKLLNDLPMMNHLQGDIATKTTPKPYTTLRKSNEVQANINVAYDEYFNIYCNVEKGDYNNLDTLVNNVIESLNLIKLTTSSNKHFTLEYVGFLGREYFDKDFDVISQGLNFKTNIIRD